MSRAAVLLTILITSFWPIPAPAEILLWKNDRGEIHITNQPKEVPPAYRAGVTRLDPALEQPITKNRTVLWVHQARSLDGITWLLEWHAERTLASESECERDRQHRIVAFAMGVRDGTPRPDGLDMGGDRLTRIRFYCFFEPYDPR